MQTRITLEAALQEITSSVTPLGIETIPLERAVGRTLAQDLTARHDQPPFPRSPLDGYALRSADTVGATPESPVSLTVVETVYAGHVPSVSLAPGQAVRIMTGAPLPQGCDCVLRQEDTDQGYPTVQIFKALSPCDNYVPAGNDFAAGTLLLPAGTVCNAAAIGIAASAGFPELPVRKLPVVGLMTTGDEVAPPQARPLPPGKIYGSNGHLLLARLQELGISTVQCCHAADDPAQVAQVLRQLLTMCDCVITTGGVSVGDKDIFHEALPLLGADRRFWRVQLKPGTPVMYSLYEGKPILSLSGNPFAALATFELLARPMLATLAGQPHWHWTTEEAILDTPFPKSSMGRRFVRAMLCNGHVQLPEMHSSGALASAIGCNCLVEFPAGSPAMEPGQTVTVYR